MTDREKIAKEKERWENSILKPGIEKFPLRDADFTTVSHFPIQMLYSPTDLENFDYLRDLGFPGEYPYTRGVQPSMYRGKLWTIRQFSGFGTPEETNERYKYILEQGGTGLSVAFDLPTLMGLDSDDPLSFGEVGKCGVAVSSLADMETLFNDIPLGKVSTSMTINSPAAVIWAMYIVAAEKQGATRQQLRGTLQNDILKEYIAQKEYVFPPRPSLRLVTDTIEFGTNELPQWNTISISGYHIREAGATAVQELAFTLSDGFTYVADAIERGVSVDQFAPRLSFFFNAHNDLFEEIAKYRAARRIWARMMKEQFGAQKERALCLRFHTQTAGCSLTAQQPMNNIIRVAIQCLAAILGGTNSLHANSMDETLALPTAEAVTISLRTQQILANESGVSHTIDPLAGSYFIESLTNQVEQQALKYIERIQAMGGMVAAIENGYPQREIQDSAYKYQQALEKGSKIIVGVNDFVTDEYPPIEILKIDQKVSAVQQDKLKKLRQERDDAAVQQTLNTLRNVAQGTENTMPYIIEAVKAYATLGEIMNVFRDVFGVYEEPAIF
ncbi:methylmalonyl-CoA mutase [candidate division CSSED10-310 bacterium]|uniref:Methylmalonyl-CoA mutase n=1 Tax=candidate division CSSED10-310 bacterium TaxID=2855610 RepID=A0ABV6YSQ3_UNCC1